MSTEATESDSLRQQELSQSAEADNHRTHVPLLPRLLLSLSHCQCDPSTKGHRTIPKSLQPWVRVSWRVPQCSLLTALSAVKAHELRSKSRQDLLKQLDDLRNELATLRVAQVTQGTPAKLAKMCALIPSPSPL